MKKTYIIPEALTVNLSMSLPLATSGHDEVSDDPDLVKGHVVDDGNSSDGSKNVWDEEW